MEQRHKDVLELSIKSSYKDLEKVANLIQRAARDAHIPEGTEEDLTISVLEAVNNAIQHGNREDKSKQVHIRIETTSGEIAVSIQDEGDGFDLKSVPDPRSGEHLLNTSGRGILIMKEFMDQVTFCVEKRGTLVEMTKRFVA